MGSLPKGVVPAGRDLAVAMAAKLSRDHAREIRDTGKLDPATAVLLSLDVSLEAYAFVVAGAPVFMMGVERAAALTRSAMVWMLGTEDIRRHAAGTLRAARWGVNRAFAASGADRIEQFIPAWYATGLRFVSRLGFRLEPSGAKTFGGDALTRVVLERKEWSWDPRDRCSTRRFRP